MVRKILPSSGVHFHPGRFYCCCFAFDLVYLKENPLKKCSVAIVFNACFQITFGFSRILFAVKLSVKV